MIYKEYDHNKILPLSMKYFLIIFISTLVVRVACMIFLQTWSLPDQWQFGYEIGYLGKSLANGHGFSISNTPTAKYPPVYPLLVGGVFALFGVYSKIAAVILFIFQSICAAFTAVYLAILGNRFFGQKEGIIAGFIWCFYPSSIFHSVVRIWYSELSIALLLLIIILILKKRPLKSSPRIVCLGFLSGLLVLTNSTMALYPALGLLLMLQRWQVGLRKCLLSMMIWGVTVGIVVAPWALRNFFVLGTPGILKSNFGMELFFGNNPYSTGGGIDKERYQALDALNKEKLDSLKKESEYSYNRYLQEKALEWIRANPLHFIKLTAKRIWFFWGKFPSSGPGVWKRYSKIQLIWYVPIFLLFIYGIKYCKDCWRDFVPIWIFLLIYPIPFYITHVQLYRYRYPVEPFLVLIAAIPLGRWFWYYQGRIKKRKEIE